MDAMADHELFQLLLGQDADGQTKIAYEDFLAGIRDSRIAVRREGAAAAISGRLLFF